MSIEEYEFTPEELALINDYHSGIERLNQQLTGAIQMVCKTKGFKGQWSLEGNKLVKKGD